MFSVEIKGLSDCFLRARRHALHILFTYPRIQNSLVQFGAVPDHVPLARHWRVIEPVSKYPSMHEYTMEWEKVVPSRREMRPWVGVAGLLHCTAERQDRKVKDAESQWIFYFSYQQFPGWVWKRIWRSSEGLQMTRGLCVIIFLWLILCMILCITISILQLNRWFAVFF